MNSAFCLNGGFLQDEAILKQSVGYMFIRHAGSGKVLYWSIVGAASFLPGRVFCDTLRDSS
jgi:hypothetical protein